MNLQLRPALSELIGTFLFVFLTLSVSIANVYAKGALGPSGMALSGGLALAVLVTVFGAVSRGYFNPAIILGLWVAKKKNTYTSVLFVLAQLAGAALAGLAIRVILPRILDGAFVGIPGLAAGIHPLGGFAIEAILSLFLMLAVFGTSIDPMAPKLGGFGVGLALTAAMLAGGPFTGAILNPALFLGFGIGAGFWDFQWLYWAAPAAGMALAGWLYPRYISETI